MAGPGELPNVFPTVVHMLADTTAAAPQQPALICGEDLLTYTEYLRCVAGFAGELSGLGVAGKRVAVLLPNSVDIAIANFAIHAARAQLVPLNPGYTPRELEELFFDATPVVLVCNDFYMEKSIN